MNTENKKAIKYLIKEVVYGNYQDELFKSLCSQHINWRNLKFALAYNEVTPFLYIILKEKYGIVSRNILNSFRDSYHLGLIRYMILFQELLKILTEAKRKNILVIPLKGFSFSEQYYRRFGFRPLADIDLLIKNKDFEKGTNLLREFGYKKYLSGASEEYWRRDQCHLGFIKKIKNIKVVIELHWALDFNRCKKEVMPNVWNRLKKVNIGGEKYHVLSPEDTLFSLVLHQRRFGKVFNLKYICDTGIILEREKLDWDYILRTAFEEKMRASLYFLLYQVQFVLDKNLKGHLDRLKIPLWHKWAISKVVERYIYSPIFTSSLSYVYLLCHFLFYDTVAYPIKYILNIPQEQFAKFYSLPIDSTRTSKKYTARFFYIIYRFVKDNLKRFFKKK